MRALLRRFSHRFAPGAISNQFLRCGGERLGIAGGRQFSADAVLDDFGNSPDPRRHARAAKAHSFQETEAKTFRFGREQPDIRRLQIIFDVGDFLPDNNALFEAQTFHFRNKRRETFPGENQQFE